MSPSFWDLMSHLVTHLVDELDIFDAVTCRWLYPLERYLGLFQNLWWNSRSTRKGNWIIVGGGSRISDTLQCRSPSQSPMSVGQQRGTWNEWQSAQGSIVKEDFDSCWSAQICCNNSDSIASYQRWVQSQTIVVQLWGTRVQIYILGQGISIHNVIGFHFETHAKIV